MKRWHVIGSIVITMLVASCAGNPGTRTLARLHDVPADLEEADLDNSLDNAMQSYRRFLEETPENAMTPEAMRRLADLQIEQQFGLIGDGEIVELPAPPEQAAPGLAQGTSGGAPDTSDAAARRESDADFEARATEQYEFASVNTAKNLQLPDGTTAGAGAEPIEAIRIYKRILGEYPSYERNDQVLYQMARAYDEVGQPDEAMEIMERLARDHAYSRYLDEVHFRRGEYLFTRRQFREAESAYKAIVGMGPGSSYYELALYKLGWALYKQELYELALHRFVALLDHKLSIGYDFGADHEEEQERRVADTYRVISLSFSNLGGPDVVNEYFASYGGRSYEDRIYSNLGEFYLSKLRYHDAAAVYTSFVELKPFHRAAPRFSMRIVDVYGEGGFPQLVVEAKKDFATKYGLQAEYWTRFDPAESPEVLGFLKTNLTDLANHYHALYQEEDLEEDKPGNYSEASRWYREFLSSFPADAESPSINYQLADLLLEHEAYAEAAQEYERTAYEYAAHDRAGAAGYAAVYAHRQRVEAVDGEERPRAVRAAIESSLRFADTFPDHENAPAVLGAAADDLYELEDFDAAIAAARKLIDRYPAAQATLRRAAWTVVAHGSFDLELYADAESAYTRVLELVPEDDEARGALIDNLAASIYQQGEQASADEDYAAAADHYLRIKDVAPTSEIRPAAEYDAAGALVRLEEWPRAADVLEAFRDAFPEHELQPEATKQLASVYRQAGELAQSAGEYERVADEAQDPEVRREAMLVAGELYEEAERTDDAQGVYLRYVDEFPRPLDIAQETRFTIAGMYEAKGDIVRYHEVLGEIVAADDTAGAERTDRSRYLAAQSALVLSKPLYDSFTEVELVQPFDASLAEKQRRMDAAMAAYEDLVEYEVREVTTAATFYIAEIYYEFSQSLLGSERPSDLDPAELVDYELAIEEEAFPFEEQSIDVHEQNFELVDSGVFNEWVRRSLERLVDMVPGRYAKPEISTGFVGSIETYAYRLPGTPDVDTEESAADGAAPVNDATAASDGAAGADRPAESSRRQGPQAEVTRAFAQ